MFREWRGDRYCLPTQQGLTSYMNTIRTLSKYTVEAVYTFPPKQILVMNSTMAPSVFTTTVAPSIQ
jgi:hypothetical protein